MAIIFLDVGAHNGESIEIASSRKYRFDRLLAIEPSSYCHKKLKKYSDSRIEIFNFGLGGKDELRELYGTGSIGASVYVEKSQRVEQTELIKIKRFDNFFNTHVSDIDQVFMKINIEGMEDELLLLLKYTNYKTIRALLISFDLEKIPSKVHLKANMRDLLTNELKVEYQELNSKNTLAKFLDTYPELRKKMSLKDYLYDFVRPDIPIGRQVRRILKPIFPRSIWVNIALFIGPNSVLRLRLKKLHK